MLPAEGRGLVCVRCREMAPGLAGLGRVSLPCLWGSSLWGRFLPSFMAENTLLPAL